MPKVSVAIVTYNQRKFVPETLSSVLEQDYEDFEIVVADDGSTDGTQELLLDYQRRYPDRIKLVLSERNQGITKNSNNAFFACTGEYIAWLGGDDLFHPGKLKAQVAALEANKDCSLCHHPLRMFDSDSGRTLKIIATDHPPKRSLEEALWAGLGFSTVSVMVRRESCPVTGFDESIPVASDTLFCIETLYRGYALHIGGVYGGYRRHLHNATKQSLINDVEKTYAKVRAAKPELNKYINRALAIGYYNEGCKQLSILKNKKAAQKNLRKAAMTSPTFLFSWPWLLLTYLRDRDIATLRHFNRFLKRFRGG